MGQHSPYLDPLDQIASEHAADIAAQTTDPDSYGLAATMQQHDALVAELEYLTAMVKEKESALRRVTEVALPEIMRGMGVSEITLDDGRKLVFGTTVQARMPTATRPQAIQWLVAQGHGDVVKATVTAKFPAGDARATSAARTIAETYGASVDVEETVHPSTLKALVRELLASGIEVPSDLFGLFVVEQVVVKPARR